MTPTTPSLISDQAPHPSIARAIVQEERACRAEDALIDLVNQIRKSNPVDDHGHDLKMNRAYLEAQKLLYSTASTTGSAPVAYEWESYNDYSDARPHWETCYGQPWWSCNGEQPKHVRNVRPLAIIETLEAARATAEQRRDSVIEACAIECEILRDRDWRDTTFYSTAATMCSIAIRALKSQQDAAIESQRSGDGS